MAVHAAEPRRSSLRQDFKDFIMRGNVVDLAVAIVLGIAFGALILAFVDGILMPLVAAIFGEPDFDALTATVGDGVLLYGTVITALINFLIIAAALFMVVKVYQHLQRPKEIDLDEKLTTQEQLLMEIRDLLARERMR